jgi:hypothetical protein
MSEATQNIIKTITYFDLFNYPLTSWELWRLADTKKTYSEFSADLNNLAHPQIANQDGFYCLSGRADTLAERQTRYNVSDRKFKRALAAAWWFSRLPWIKLVCLANQIGAHNLRAGGDLDFFIVTSPRRLWLSRLFLNSALTILNLRPTDGKFSDTLCLSFWISDDNLNLAGYRLADDPYFRYWLAGLTPLYDRGWTYDKLIEANEWLVQELPNWQRLKVLPRRHLKTSGRDRRPLQIFQPLERLAKKFQWLIMPDNLKALANHNTQVVISDCVLKLHPTDRRQEFLEKYQEKLNDSGLRI